MPLLYLEYEKWFTAQGTGNIYWLMSHSLIFKQWPLLNPILALDPYEWSIGKLTFFNHLIH
jgi:hypothetical protein